MEKRKYLRKEIFWSAVIMITHLAAFATAVNVTKPSPPPPQQEFSEDSGFAWSAWGKWSPCSKTCGGGVSIQERQCLPRSRPASVEGTLPPPVITVRVTRETRGCVGVARRYHECNTNPCHGGPRDSRAEQCAAYNRRPFRGRFYTWVPYVDGDSPCMLNCRPLGQQFFASLALVADGTSCTKPGFRAICVQGTCKVVGKESVLAVSSSKELHCGRRLVSGLFSRLHLPLGYSYVTTVPRGACNLNIVALKPSENYIALKLTNGSYFINGKFAISSPGNYDVAGSRIIYLRYGGLDSVVALGPLQEDIDIMVLYTDSNVDFKYQYLTPDWLSVDLDIPDSQLDIFDPANPGEKFATSSTKHPADHGENFATSSTKHIRNHQNDVYTTINSDLRKEKKRDDNEDGKVVVDGRKFMWKIMSYMQCSRTCGGGIQVGKYVCVEEIGKSYKKVSPVHCVGSAPPSRRRKCGNLPCPPKWRATLWSQCPKCGPATRTRIVGCVEDRYRGITKVRDSYCLEPKPPTTEICNIPKCPTTSAFLHSLDTETAVAEPRRYDIENFRDVPVHAFHINEITTNNVPDTVISATAPWLYSDWSECIGWCVGGGIQTRGVLCADPSGCTAPKNHDTWKYCIPSHKCDAHEGQWFTGEWSPCSSPCGKQIRGVICIGGTGRRLKDSACKPPKPVVEKICDEECKPDWYYSDWSQCTGNCSTGEGYQSRTIWCSTPHGSTNNESSCDSSKPESTRYCTLECSGISTTITTTTTTTTPDLSTTESQRSSSVLAFGFETPNTSPTTYQTSPSEHRTTETLGECRDRLDNCYLAVQARLCRYHYYTDMCCYSCLGRN